MIIFLGEKINVGTISLFESEVAHCAKILRKQVGDTIVVHDGSGSVYTCTITSISKKQVLAQINSSETHPRLSTIHLGISLTKNIDRIEWLVSKVTEIGVTHLTFIKTQRSERSKCRMDRIEKIMQSAVKQSLKHWFVEITPTIVPFAEIVKSTASTKYIASYAPEHANLMDAVPSSASILMLIGPEGDFTQEEVNGASQHGFESVNLGSQRLRTETAGLYASTLLRARQDQAK